METANDYTSDHGDTLQAHIDTLGISEKTISILRNAGIITVQECLDFLNASDNYLSVSGDPDLVVMYTEIEPILIKMGLRERRE